MPLKYATPTQTANVDAFGNTVKTPDLVRDNRSSAASPNTASVSQQSQTTKGNANLDGNSNRVTNDPVNNPNGKNNTNRVGGGGNSVGNRPYTPRPVNNPSTTAPNSTPSNSASPVSSPATGVSKLGALLNSPVGKALGVAGAVLAIPSVAADVGGALGYLFNLPQNITNAFEKDRLDKLVQEKQKQAELAVKNRQKIDPANSKGSFNEPNNANYTPPFNGGQSTGIRYYINARVSQPTHGRTSEVMNMPEVSAFGAITEARVGFDANGYVSVIYSGRDSVGAVASRSFMMPSVFPNVPFVVDFFDVVRSDGFADIGGNIPNPNPPSNTYVPPLDKAKDKGDLADPNNPHSPNFFPWLPSVSVAGVDALQPELLPNPANDNKPFKEPEKPVYAPVVPLTSPAPASPQANTSPAFATPASKTPASPASPTANNGMGGFTSTPATQTLASQTYANGMTNDDYNRLTNRQPVTTTPTRSDVSPSQSPNLLTQPLSPPAKAPVAPSTPNTPSSPDIGTIATVLGAIGLAISAIGQRTTKIDGQTTPQAQQTNAQQGVCNAFQPNQCGYEGTKQAATEATNPIKDIANENKGLLGALGVNLASILAAIVANFTKLFTFLDINAKVEAFKSTITLALTVHNAMMLSTNLTTTLGAIIDNVLGTFGQTYKSTDGTTVTASEFLNATVKNWIIGVIGIDNYTNLSDAFATANRIYQAGINVLSTVQSMLDSANTVVQMTGINVAKIGNAIRDDGVVNPKSYAHMDDTKSGNRPSTLGRFEQLTTTISDFDSKAQNLVTVTAVPTQIKDAVKQSKEDIKAFNDARDVNSTANVEAKAAKLDQIKALKAITEATISKKDDDT